MKNQLLLWDWHAAHCAKGWPVISMVQNLYEKEVNNDIYEISSTQKNKLKQGNQRLDTEDTMKC